VPPDGSGALRSLPDTITTLLFGWWSLSGFFWTIQVLFTNLGGGRDATQEILDATGGGDAKLAQQALDEHDKAQLQQSIRAVLLFVGIVGGVALIAWLVPIVTDWYTKRPVSARAPSTQVNGRELHLQGIFYNGNGRSTAVIDRKSVSVGDHIPGYTVLAIGPQSVTVKSVNGQEKTLQLSDRRE